MQMRTLDQKEVIVHGPTSQSVDQLPFIRGFDGEDLVAQNPGLLFTHWKEEGDTRCTFATICNPLQISRLQLFAFICH